jgi:hypothetical protein
VNVEQLQVRKSLQESAYKRHRNSGLMSDLSDLDRFVRRIEQQSLGHQPRPTTQASAQSKIALPSGILGLQFN